MNRKTKLLLSLGLSTIILVACGSNSSQESSEQTTEETTTIRLGVTPGPYSELFMDEVAPVLEEQGYQIEPIEISDLATQNTAMDNDEVDLNVDQHSAYTENFNKEAGGDLTTMTPIPTIVTGLYPANKTSIDDVEEGDIVAVPQDPSNFSRAVQILADLGWIEIAEDVPPMQVEEQDIVENHAGIDLTPMDSASIPQAVPDLDYYVLPGSIAYDVGVDFDTALTVENLIDELFLQVVVQGEDQDEQWVQDVVGVYESPEFRDRVEEINSDPDQPNWVLPE